MNKNSIIFSITITFAIALIIIFTSLFILLSVTEKREKHFIYKNNHDASKIFLREYKHNGYSKVIADNLSVINFSVVLDAKDQNKILNNKNTKFFRTRSKDKGKVLIQNLELQDKYYVYIKTSKQSYILVNNNNTQNNQNLIIVIFLAIFSIIVFLYITTLKKLKPLNELKQKVQYFGEEEFDVSCASEKKDEISMLANEFDKSAKKLKKLKESRNVFIRNIMHELKTPITKGKFLTELPRDDVNTGKLKKVFYRLESLINEFASIEELISTKKHLMLKEYYMDDLVDEAIDLLMCSQESVTREYENIKISVDFKLFTIAVKNLLDNAIKYSDDSKVMIKAEDGYIVFENTGNQLKYSLEKYFEPFFKGEDIKSNQSFGLGLYIVKHILDAHKFDFNYSYYGEKNIFTIKYA